MVSETLGVLSARGTPRRGTVTTTAPPPPGMTPEVRALRGSGKTRTVLAQMAAKPSGRSQLKLRAFTQERARQTFGCGCADCMRRYRDAVWGGRQAPVMTPSEWAETTSWSDVL